MGRLISSVVLVFALALPASAWAGSVKVSHLNLGDQPLQTITGEITVTNQSKEPIGFAGLSLGACSRGCVNNTPNLSIQLVRSPNQCWDLLVNRVPLGPKQSCTSTVALTPLAPGNFEAWFCVDAAPGDFHECNLIRSRVR